MPIALIDSVNIIEGKHLGDIADLAIAMLNAPDSYLVDTVGWHARLCQCGGIMLPDPDRDAHRCRDCFKVTLGIVDLSPVIGG